MARRGGRARLHPRSALGSGGSAAPAQPGTAPALLRHSPALAHSEGGHAAERSLRSPGRPLRGLPARPRWGGAERRRLFWRLLPLLMDVLCVFASAPGFSFI